MSSFSLSGGVEVLGFISPTDTSDEYAVIDPLYGIDGLRNVSSLSELNAITSLRRRSGMVVGVNNGSQYYKLNPPPWNGTISDWSLFNPGVFTGGTVTGNTVFTNNLSASVFSAATYLNLPIDNTVTGGTYNPSNGSVTFVNNTGGTFTVTGFITGFTDIRVTGYTYSNNTFTIFDSSGNTFSATINTMTGLTVNGLLSATTISASTYQNLPITTLTVNSTPISGGTPNGVLFQSPTNVLSANDGFVYSGTFPNNFVGINSPTPIYSLDVNGAIYQRTGELLITSSGGVNKEGPFIASSGGTNRTTQLGILDNSTVPVGIDMFATNNSFPSSYINFRVNNADLVRMSGSFVGIGTTTDAGFRLDVNGTARIQNQLTTTGSITALSGTSRGTFLNQTLVATANNDVLVGLDIQPTFTTGAFTGVQSIALRLGGSVALTSNNTFGIGTTTTQLSIIYSNIFQANGTAILRGGGNTIIQVGGGTEVTRFFSTGNVVIQNGGTFTDAGFRLDVNGTARVQGEANVSFLSLGGNTAVNNSGSIMILGASGAWTGVRVPRYFEITGSINASAGFARGTFINQTLVATANNDTLYALDIAPSATTGSFTGVTSVPLRIRNSSGTGNAFYIDGIGNAVIGGSLNTGTLYGTANINLSSGSGNLLLQTNFTVNTGLTMFRNTRNIVIQDGGTFTDAGFRLDVSGNTRINGGLTATTISATTYQNLPSDVIIINSTPIQSGFTGGILFQSSASTVSQSSNLFWDNANGRLGIGTSTPESQFKVQTSGGTGAIQFSNTGVRIGTTSGIGYDRIFGDSTIMVIDANSTLDVRYQTISRMRIPSTGNVLINTTTDAGYKLDVNGIVRIQNQLSTTGSITASSSIARGTHLNQTLVAAANNDILIGLDVSPTYINGSFTGVQNIALRHNGNIIPSIGDTFTLGTGTLPYALTWSNWVRGTSNLLLQSGTDIIFNNTTNNVGRFFNTTGNLALQNGGTFADAGYRLDVSGSTRVRGNTIISATTSTVSGSTLTVVGSGSTQPIFTVQGSSGELFSVTDSLIGSLFSVNDISGLPILEVFSNNTVLMGTYLAPSLNTTLRVTPNSGTTTVYTIPQSAYTGAFFEYTVSDGINLRAGNIMSVWRGTTVNFTETQTTDIGSTSGLTFTMSANTSNVILQTSATTNNWIVKTIIRSI